MLIAGDGFAIAWAKRREALCFVKFVVDLIPLLLLEKYMKTVRQRESNLERIFLRPAGTIPGHGALDTRQGSR